MTGKWNVEDPDAGKPRYERFGGIAVFRPGWTATIALRNESEEHFRSRFKTGTYSGRDAVNGILHHQFAFYTWKLGQLIPRLASRDYLEFLLFQYNCTADVESRAKDGRLTEQEEAHWQATGPILRRALKYLAERTVLLSPPHSSRVQEPANMLHDAEQALICAEQLTQLYMESDKVFTLFSDTTTVEVLPEGELDLFRTHCEQDFSSDIVFRVHRDTKHRDRFVPSLPPQMLPPGQDQYLADPFRQTIGVTLQEALEVIRAVLDHAEAPATGFKIPFCSREMIVSQTARLSGFPRQSIEKALAGFAVTRSGMESEGREIFKPKQEHRAYRRGFFEMPHETGPHFAWSQRMAFENAALLIADIPMKQVPVEWNSPAVESALGRLSNAVGKWFETSVVRNFRSLGFIGIESAKDAVGQGRTALPIPPDIGEIDFLGHSQTDHAIIIAECKFVRGGAEPKFYRDDLKEFVTGDNAFMKRLGRKAEWVISNLPSVRHSLSDATGSPIGNDTRRVLSVMVTYYPSCAAHFCNSAPCVSLAEFMLDYQYGGKWPYRTGQYPAD